MLTTDEVIEGFHSLIPRAYPVLRRWVFDQEGDGRTHTEWRLTLFMSGREGARRTLRLEFEGVRDLEVDWPPWGLVQFTLIEIRSLKAQGLEGLNYRVTEEGEGAFKFSCREFSAEFVEGDSSDPRD